MRSGQIVWWRLLAVMVLGGSWILWWEHYEALKQGIVMTTRFTKSVGSGSVFVLRRRGACGAFQIVEQGYLGEPGRRHEELIYRWRYRDDGRSQLSPPSAVHEGEARGPRVAFGPFDLAWSAAEFGRGYLYYPRKYDEPVQTDDLRVAVTALSTLEGASCDDSRWIFRASSSDPGGK
jgi:hypothetical protein